MDDCNVDIVHVQTITYKDDVVDDVIDKDECLDQSEDELDRLINESIEPVNNQLEEWQVLTHIFKSFVGTGILGLPSAVMHGGIVLGPLILVGLGAICMYNIKLLVDTARNMRHNLNISRISYSSISENVFQAYGKRAGTVARYLTDFLLCSLQIGFCCVYVVFIAHNIQFAVGSLDVRIWMLVILPFLIVPSLISNIRTLAYLTTIGNVIVLVGLGTIYQYLLTHVQSPSRLPATNGVLNACVAFGQIVYAFEGVAVILPTEEKLKSRGSFDWLFKVSGCLVILLYASMGILGYLTFGQETLGSITLNLPNTAVYQTLQGAFCLMVFFTYPLQLFVSVDIIKSYFPPSKSTDTESFLDDALLKSLLVFLTCVLGICIPQLDNFMSLVGSVCGVSVGLILPPIIHAQCFWNQGLTPRQFVLDIFILAIGVFTFVTGFTASMYAIFHRFVEYPGHTTGPIV
eukprot:TCONS_00006479-protein